ncbi:MAG: TIGR01777 family oxidoreductase [Phycisphaerae bacterium]
MTPGPKIVIPGGTGALGTGLAEFLLHRNYDVLILGRRPAFQTPARYLQWNADTPGSWIGELESAFAVINLAGRSVNCRYTRRNKKQILKSRTRSTQLLGEVIAQCKSPPQIWLNASTATIYKHATNGPHDELHGHIGATPEAHDAFSIHVAQSWEHAIFTAPTPPGTRKIALRTAIVFSRRPHTVLPILARLTRLGLGGRMGTGAQWVSWIHEQDFCRAVLFLLQRPDLRGIFNLAAPRPLRNADMMHLLQQTLRIPVALPATTTMLRLGALFLRTEPELVLKSRRVIPTRLQQAGFQFEYPKLEAALKNLLSPQQHEPALHAPRCDR